MRFKSIIYFTYGKKNTHQRNTWCSSSTSTTPRQQQHRATPQDGQPGVGQTPGRPPRGAATARSATRTARTPQVAPPAAQQSRPDAAKAAPRQRMVSHRMATIPPHPHPTHTHKPSRRTVLRSARPPGPTADPEAASGRDQQNSHPQSYGGHHGTEHRPAGSPARRRTRAPPDRRIRLSVITRGHLMDLTYPRPPPAGETGGGGDTMSAEETTARYLTKRPACSGGPSVA